MLTLRACPYDELPSVRSALRNAMRLQGVAPAGEPRHFTEPLTP